MQVFAAKSTAGQIESGLHDVPGHIEQPGVGGERVRAQEGQRVSDAGSQLFSDGTGRLMHVRAGGPAPPCAGSLASAYAIGSLTSMSATASARTWASRTVTASGPGCRRYTLIVPITMSAERIGSDHKTPSGPMAISAAGMNCGHRFAASRPSRVWFGKPESNASRHGPSWSTSCRFSSRPAVWSVTQTVTRAIDEFSMVMDAPSMASPGCRTPSPPPTPSPRAPRSCPP